MSESTIAEQLEQIHLTLKDVVAVMRLQTELLLADRPAADAEPVRHLRAVPDLGEGARFAP
ncbi:hypothetical protein [Actinomadura sp. NTSP31]|uniref:hypothetical protein n=1 Tax=Actinomadura sp. NTSP31 TaxID=1735447 RepID=UPI0035C0E7DA